MQIRLKGMNMKDKITKKDPPERRSESRETSNKFHSVEMKLSNLPIYLFKLKDISSTGACFLVKERSAILQHLEVGLRLNMRYHSEDEMKPSEIFRSEIKYINKSDKKPYKGHFLVGIKILEKINSDDQPEDN